MMRSPPRLTWDLTKVRIAQKLFGPLRYPWALRLDLAQLRDTEATSPNSINSSSEISSRDSQALAQVRESSAPVVWIGGNSPLQHARIGHLAREIANCGRTVFMEMDSAHLRRRIHEFRPVSRLYLVLPLNGLEDAHDSRAQHTGNFRATMEALRTARLSGFHICIETTIFPGFDRSGLLQLAKFIAALNVDGWIHKRPAPTANDQTTNQALDSARQLIPSRHWRTFSALLDLTSTSAQPAAEKKRIPNQAVEKVEKVPTREAHRARNPSSWASRGSRAS
jgi:pyruvate-formate lyase-activating enzyme